MPIVQIETPRAGASRRSVTCRVGGVPVGGGHPVVVQSMTNTDTADPAATAAQIRLLADAGSELVRITVNTREAAAQVSEIVRRVRDAGVTAPIIGDFHYNGHTLLTEYPACAAALDKYRINPGNVGVGEQHDPNFRRMIEVAVAHGKPVRIGVNWGSLDRALLTRLMDENARRSAPLEDREVVLAAMRESALASAALAERFGQPHDGIILSAKVSDVRDLIALYRALAAACDYPLHLGLTEAGLGVKGIVASTAALAVLLVEGIGDTIRVSLTPEPGGDRAEEVRVCQQVLQSLGIRHFSPQVTSCPGCGRTTSTFFQDLAAQVTAHIQARLRHWRGRYPGVEELKVAVMGCVVNGPGESKHADIGISLPGTGESPSAPVYVEGRLKVTLRGDTIAADFARLLDEYVEARYGKGAAVEGQDAGQADEKDIAMGASGSVDLVIRAGRIHALSADQAVYRSIAIRGDTIVALAPDAGGLNHLAGTGARVIDDDSLTWLPAFYDTHNHLLEATQNARFVPVNRARSIAEMVALIREQAARTPAGRWIQTSNAWHEQKLAEGRLPTAQELDQATRDHPVLVRRGGHMAVLNTRGLDDAGITPSTPDPPGGKLGRRPDGTLDGMLEGGAQYALVHVPPAPIGEQITGLEASCRRFTAAGIGTVRDPVVSPDGLRLYQAAAIAGRLDLRVRPLLLVFPDGPVEKRIAGIHGLGTVSGAGDDWVKVWGLKFVLDGGPEGGALEQPYASDPTFTGHLNWDPQDLFEVMNAAVAAGWRVATHAIGDRAVRTVLDVYERVLAANSTLAAGTFVIEHAFLADRVQRARAIRMGVHITVQHALLHALGASLVRLWGPERTRPIMPVKAWLEEGAELSAGTDYPIGFYEPLRTVWGMMTRQTESVGVQGPEYAIDRETAFRLAIVAGAKLSAEDERLGPLRGGRLADLVAFRGDPLTCPVDQLPELEPVLTIVGGRAVFDPEGILSATASTRGSNV